MIQDDRVLVMDIDGTLCMIACHVSYDQLVPNDVVLYKLKEYKEKGFYIILYTSQNMRMYGGNLSRINAETAKIRLHWLNRFDITYDEIHDAQYEH